MGWNSIARGLADEVAGFTMELILGLVGNGRTDVLGCASDIEGGDKRTPPWSPPFDEGTGTNSR